MESKTWNIIQAEMCLLAFLVLFGALRFYEDRTSGETPEVREEISRMYEN